MDTLGRHWFLRCVLWINPINWMDKADAFGSFKFFLPTIKHFNGQMVLSQCILQAIEMNFSENS